MEEITILGSLFVFLTLIGFLIAYLYGRKSTQFKWSEYLAIMIFPILFVIFLVFYYDFSILKMFAASALIGFLAEGLLGFVYHKVLNRRLWTYTRFSIKGYTSFLSIPFWGIGGIVFWFISKLVGL